MFVLPPICRLGAALVPQKKERRKRVKISSRVLVHSPPSQLPEIESQQASFLVEHPARCSELLTVFGAGGLRVRRPR